MSVITAQLAYLLPSSKMLICKIRNTFLV